jgi:hypothetical protein
MALKGTKPWKIPELQPVSYLRVNLEVDRSLEEDCGQRMHFLNPVTVATALRM